MRQLAVVRLNVMLPISVAQHSPNSQRYAYFFVKLFQNLKAYNIQLYINSFMPVSLIS